MLPSLCDICLEHNNDMGRAFEFRKARKFKRWAAMSKTFARLNKDIIIAIREGNGA